MLFFPSQSYFLVNFVFILTLIIVFLFQFVNFKSFLQYNQAWNSGGSILVQHSHATFKSCTFDYETVIAGYGGSLCIEIGGNVTVADSLFKKCTGPTGGSIAVESESILLLMNVNVTASVSTSDGGGVFVDKRSIVLIYSSTVYNNKAIFGAGLSVNDKSIIYATISSITRNIASDSGGGVSCKESKIVIDVGNAKNNWAELYGGGFYASSCHIILDNLTISGNSAKEGGGIYAVSTTVEIHNVKEQSNSAENMGNFMIVTLRSILISKYLTITDIDSNSTAILGNSIAEMRHTQIHISSNKSYCPVTALRRSRLAIPYLYSINGSKFGGEIEEETICAGSSSEILYGEAGCCHFYYTNYLSESLIDTKEISANLS